MGCLVELGLGHSDGGRPDGLVVDWNFCSGDQAGDSFLERSFQNGCQVNDSCSESDLNAERAYQEVLVFGDVKDASRPMLFEEHSRCQQGLHVGRACHDDDDDEYYGGPVKGSPAWQMYDLSRSWKQDLGFECAGQGRDEWDRASSERFPVQRVEPDSCFGRVFLGSCGGDEYDGVENGERQGLEN